MSSTMVGSIGTSSVISAKPVRMIKRNVILSKNITEATQERAATAVVAKKSCSLDFACNLQRYQKSSLADQHKMHDNAPTCQENSVCEKNRIEKLGLS